MIKNTLPGHAGKVFFVIFYDFSQDQDGKLWVELLLTRIISDLSPTEMI